MKAKYKEAISYTVLMLMALSVSFWLSPVWGGTILFWIGLIFGGFFLLVIIGTFMPALPPKSDKANKSETIVISADAAITNCPECKSNLIECNTETRTKSSTHLAGQFLFGIIGNIVAGALSRYTVEISECKDCGYKWERKIEKDIKHINRQKRPKQRESDEADSFFLQSQNEMIKTPDLILDYSYIVKQVIMKYLPNDDIHIEGEIPRKKEQNSRSICSINPSEPIYALIDCTVSGSAKNCVLFTSDAMVCHNDWVGKTPGVISIPYRDFPSRTFRSGGFKEISLDNNKFLNVSGSGVSKAKLFEILEGIKKGIANDGR